MLSIGSCFSGIGGLELGLELTGGFETKWQIENNEYASRVLAKHWPNAKRYKDIRDVVRPEPVDIICGGFPCQDVSLAGKRVGLKGKRSTLWGEMFRIVCEVKPRWVLAENVPGLLSSDDGRFFGNILRDLAHAGYNAEWGMLSAAAVGAPHRRERIFVLAYSSDESKFQTNSEVYSFRKNRESWIGNSGNYWREMAKPSWPIYPSWLVRSIDGLPSRVERSKCLGNAVVPQVAQKIGEMILNMELKARRDEK